MQTSDRMTQAKVDKHGNIRNIVSIEKVKRLLLCNVNAITFLFFIIVQHILIRNPKSTTSPTCIYDTPGYTIQDI